MPDEAAWGNCRPVSYELRSCLHDRWVRFHSLPGSQRYASNDDEYAELLRRHKTVIAELLQDQPGDGEQELLIFTASWSADSEPKERDAELLMVIPAATYWTSVLTADSEREEPAWTHLWVSATHLDGEDLAQLLCLVADYAPGASSSPPPKWAGSTHLMTAALMSLPLPAITETNSVSGTRIGFPPIPKGFDIRKVLPSQEG